MHTYKYGPHEKTIALGVNADKEDAQKCMKKIDSRYGRNPHSGAPFYSLPPPDQLLHCTSASTTICGNSSNISTLLVIVSRLSSYSRRQVIRETVASFPACIRSNWRRLFLVGKPENENSVKNIEMENKMFGDVVVTNVADTYGNNCTLKMLISLKFFACYCPQAKYYVRADDDVYFKAEKLDRVIEERRKKVHKMTSRDGVGLYLGYSSTELRVQREGRWAVSKNEYSADTWIPYMQGQLFVLSASAVQGMPLDCPFHCTGLYHEDYMEINNMR